MNRIAFTTLFAGVVSLCATPAFAKPDHARMACGEVRTESQAPTCDDSCPGTVSKKKLREARRTKNKSAVKTKQKGHITGKVVSCTDGQAVPGVKVSVDGKKHYRAITNASGGFVVKNVAPNSYRVGAVGDAGSLLLADCVDVDGSKLSDVGTLCVCPRGMTQCGASCSDFKSDDVNCGSCGKSCAAGETCANGSCTGAVTSKIKVKKYTNEEPADLIPGPFVAVGATVQWTYQVENKGKDTLSSVTVSDDKEPNVVCPSTQLEPGQTMTCTSSGTAVAGQYTNEALACGEDSQGQVVCDSSRSHYFGVIPGSPTPTRSPEVTANAKPTKTPRVTPTATPSCTVAGSTTPTPTVTPVTTTTGTPTNTPTDTPTETPTTPTATPTDTPTDTPVTPTATPTDTPTDTPVTATATPTDTPTDTPVVLS